MKTKQKLSAAILCVVVMLSVTNATAQINYNPVFSQLRLETRADFDYLNSSTEGVDEHTQNYGMRGRYFNLLIGGSISDHFNYFFRQRIIAKPGTVNLFDNTDFLYIDYRPNQNWVIRMGKDAMAVGGMEYDASPIDVLFSSIYWDNFYCFQPAVSGAYRSTDGNHMVIAQISNSPYIYYGAPLNTGLGNEWKSGLFAYNLYYSGTFGHLKLKHSVNMIQRSDKNFMNYIALGHELTYDKWDFYLDLIHHAQAFNDWGHNFALVTCANFKLGKGFSFYIKGAYEQNKSNEVLEGFGNSSTGFYDCLIEAGHSYIHVGGGAEYIPPFCPDFKVHFFVANRNVQVAGLPTTNQLEANIGITWYMDIHKMVRRAVEKMKL